MILKFIKSSYDSVKQALAKTSSLLGSKLRSLFQGKIDEHALEQLEQTLYEADLGVAYAQELTHKIRAHLEKHPQATSDELLAQLHHHILTGITESAAINLAPLPAADGPLIILVVGVNGNGKTTTVARLARHFQLADKKVLIGAADTFRAAAIEQLETWAHQLKAEIVKGLPKSDPAAVAFDAVSAGKARKTDVVIIDTAGRLHTKTPLMQELEKIRRSCRKISAHAPHETLLVLDATTGQNAIDQARTFHQFTPITGLVLTKLDGSAKGGIVLAIQKQLGIPVKFIGVGEGMDDLQPFEPKAFVDALFGYTSI